MFADDDTMSESGTVAEIERKLQEDINELIQWCDENGMSVEPSKSSVCLFTPWTSPREQNPNLTINGVPLEVVNLIKILAVIFSRHGSYAPHVDWIIERCRKGLKILRALAGSSWGCQKEVILMTYKALILPIINYACAVWFPMCAQSKLDQLQVIQNSALRIATGCHLKASIHHLHAECKLLLVKEHLELLCSQFLVGTLREVHPSHSVVRSLPARRSRTLPTRDFGPKETLYSLFKDKVLPFLVNDVIRDEDYKRVVSTLHTEKVRESVNAQPSNAFLGILPPPMAEDEKKLSRSARTTLAQLRSGHSIRLNVYRRSIGLADNDLCPDCGTHQHTTQHLFNCRAKPTTLTPADLWSHPSEVITFLVSSPPFNDIPPVVPPAPRPPPEPPP